MEHIIPFSKKKILLILSGSAVFFGLSVFLIVIEEPPPPYPLLLLKITGILGLIFFSLAFMYALRKLSDNSPGLIINSQGIQDNSSAIAVGFIPWFDIDDIAVTSVKSQKFIIIYVRNPYRYLKKGNVFKNILLKANYRFYGSPVQISSGSLEINFDKLLSIIREYRLKYA